MDRRAEQQYLARYAEPEARIALPSGRRFGHVLTIPAAGEGPELRDLLAAIPAGWLGPVLVIVVVNATVEASAWIHDANRDWLAGLERNYGAGDPIGPLARSFEIPNGALLVIDRASPGRLLPAGQGVGLARKIGADLALALCCAGAVESRWIHCTDADASLPADYFDQARLAHSGATALAYAYRHLCPTEPALRRAAWEYEISLRYYVRGLAYAGSPYAYPTIGSTLAIRARGYAQVRGFPRRRAAEDFYVLNKLAKLGRVQVLSGSPIELSSRVSQRTPFGTGRALSEAATTPRALYHPAVFDYLAAWLGVLRAIAEAPGADPRALLHGAPRARTSPALLEAALDSVDALERARASARRPDTRLAQLHQAFDAARTLKLIHALRELAFPSLPLESALQMAPFAPARADPIAQAVDSAQEMARLAEFARALGRPD